MRLVGAAPSSSLAVLGGHPSAVPEWDAALAWDPRSCHRFVERFSRLADGERDETAQVSVAGRVWTKREQGQKLVFYDIRGDGHKIQAPAAQRSNAWPCRALGLCKLCSTLHWVWEGSERWRAFTGCGRQLAGR